MCETIEFSGILDRFPEIGLETQKVGVFGKLSRLNVKVDEGARVEIYREITAVPSWSNAAIRMTRTTMTHETIC